MWYGIETDEIRNLSQHSSVLSESELRSAIETSYDQRCLVIWFFQIAIFATMFGIAHLLEVSSSWFDWLGHGVAFGGLAIAYIYVSHRVTLRIVAAGVDGN
ncbi:MAG: hypothetical protein AAF525_11745 [Pseudomonadota bacterium]